MRALMGITVMGLLTMAVPIETQASGKWTKGAPFPAPSEELVGGSGGEKFYVFGGLGPGWIPQGLV